ncbi:MAG: hypothetical protein J6T39_02930, partial [Clostridia bacterium]|nr:hypothetical protein [Clostridia bacterium]
MDIERVKQIILEVKNIGYRVRTSFILDYPGTTKEDLLKTKEMIFSIKPHELRLHYLAYRVGTPVFEENKNISNKSQYIHNNKPNVENDDLTYEIENLLNDYPSFEDVLDALVAYDSQDGTTGATYLAVKSILNQILIDDGCDEYEVARRIDAETQRLISLYTELNKVNPNEETLAMMFVEDISKEEAEYMVKLLTAQSSESLAVQYMMMPFYMGDGIAQRLENALKLVSGQKDAIISILSEIAEDTDDDSGIIVDGPVNPKSGFSVVYNELAGFNDSMPLNLSDVPFIADLMVKLNNALKTDDREKAALVLATLDYDTSNAQNILSMLKFTPEEIITNYIASEYKISDEEDLEDLLDAVSSGNLTTLTNHLGTFINTRDIVSKNIKGLVNSLVSAIVYGGSPQEAAGFEYVVGEGYSYNNRDIANYNGSFDWSSVGTRPTVIHYDESLNTEFTSVFNGSGEYGVELDAAESPLPPETGVALNIGFAMICVALVAGLALVSLKRKEQY